MPQHKFVTADIVRLSADAFQAIHHSNRHSRGATLDLRLHPQLPTGGTTRKTATNTTTTIRTVADTRSGTQTLAVALDSHVPCLPRDPDAVSHTIAVKTFTSSCLPQSARDSVVASRHSDRRACFTLYPDHATIAGTSAADALGSNGFRSYRPAPLAPDQDTRPSVWGLVLNNSHPEHEMVAAVRVMSPNAQAWDREFAERDRPLVVRADSWTLIKLCAADVLCPMRVVVEWFRMQTVNGVGTRAMGAATVLKVDRIPLVLMDMFIQPTEEDVNLEMLHNARAQCIQSIQKTADEFRRNQLSIPGNDNVLDKLLATRFFYGNIDRNRKQLRNNPHSHSWLPSLIPLTFQSERKDTARLHHARSPIPQLRTALDDFYLPSLLRSAPTTDPSSSPLRLPPARARISPARVKPTATPPWRVEPRLAPPSAFVGLVSTMPGQASASTVDTSLVSAPSIATVTEAVAADRFTPPAGRFTPPGIREADQQSPIVKMDAGSRPSFTILLGDVFARAVEGDKACGQDLDRGVVGERDIQRAAVVEVVDLVSSSDEE